MWQILASISCYIIPDITRSSAMEGRTIIYLFFEAVFKFGQHVSCYVPYISHYTLKTKIEFDNKQDLLKILIVHDRITLSVDIQI
jgi:hypothetical protein